MSSFDYSHDDLDRNSRKILLNHDYQRTYPPFVIPSVFYNVYHVHQFTSMETIQLIIEHFEQCYHYSIDTESDKNNHELCLIQVQSIPRRLPMFVVLVALKHLPLPGSPLFMKLESMFSLLFRLENTVFSWGELRHEIRNIQDYNVGSWIIRADLINLQNKFNNWYQRALPSCEVCSSKQKSTTSSMIQPICLCSKNYPYDNLSCKWSLQNAMIYTFQRFLDKSSTRQSWGVLLDPMYSSLSSSKLQRLINYCINDCFAVTYLHQPIQKKLEFMPITWY